MPIISYDDLKEKKGKILHSLIDLAGIVDNLNDMGLAVNGSALLVLKKKLENDNFKVLVIGEFKNGKSTFINSLMGEKVLPAYSTPCTAVINEVIYGKEKRAILYFKNPLPEEMSPDIQPSAMQHIKKYEGQDIPPIELDVADLVDYVAIPDPTKDQADSIKELPYSKVVLEYPIELCHDGIEIIDSPGLNENGTRTKVTEEYLNQADAILFVFRCPKIAGASEMDYITDQIHARGYNDIFFICNAINQIPEDEQDRLIKFGNKKLAPLTTLGESGIFYVDALGALEAKQAKDADSLSHTGMLEFEDALSEYLRNNKGKAKLMQIIEPGKSFIEALRTQHIKSYIASLNQDAEALEKRIKDAMPKLDLAEKRKDVVGRKIDLAMQELQKQIQNLMDSQYSVIIGKIPDAVDKMDLDNQMTANPFKQKSKKEALEKEVISKLEHFVQKEMGTWIKTDLKETIDAFVDKLEEDLGEDIDIFYENLDEFRYEVSGVSNPKDISGFERVSATILGTIVGGPMYGALGASLGFGEIAKRSAITLGASFAAGAVLAFTPIGIAAITTATTVALASAGILQLVTGGQALTDKYKKQLKNGFIDKLKESREEDCKNYALNITKDVREKFDLVNEALDNEIKMEKSKVRALEDDRDKNADERERKLYSLKQWEKDLDSIERALTEVGDSIETSTRTPQTVQYASTSGQQGQSVQPAFSSTQQNAEHTSSVTYSSLPLYNKMQKGQRVVLSTTPLDTVNACFGWNTTDVRCDVDVSAFLLGENGKVISDSWFVFYGQTHSPDQSIELMEGGTTDRKKVQINLKELNPSVKKIVFVLTINEALQNCLNFGMMKDAYVRILNQTGKELVSFMMTEYYTNVISMMIGELYQHNGTWKFNAIGGGVEKDLAGLCELYGVQVVS